MTAQRGSTRSAAPEAEVLLLLAAPRLTPGAAERVAELCRQRTFRWNALATAAVRHGVAPLVLTNVSAIGTVVDAAPPKLLAQWNQIKVRNILLKKRQADAARRIFEFFGRLGTRVMLLKGAALDAVVYAEPWYIQSIDLDLMADQRWADLSREEKDAVAILLKRTSVELDYMRHHDFDMNGVLDIDYARVWADARPVAFLGTQSYVMSPEDMLLSACVNLCRKRYVLLKGLIAVRELIRVYPAMNWETLARNARASGASRIVYGALRITSDVLAAELPEGAAEAFGLGGGRRAAIDWLCRRLNTQIFQGRQVRERQADRLTSHALRWATYRFPQLGREAVAQVQRVRFWYQRSG